MKKTTKRILRLIVALTICFVFVWIFYKLGVTSIDNCELGVQILGIIGSYQVGSFCGWLACKLVKD